MEHRAITAPLQYSAFVSYNHRDRKIATRLQRRIETYRLPRKIVRETGVARLKPVFRDRDELTAASDLSEAVRAALRQSEHLIVVCTPNSAQSEWVGHEIDYFRSVHGDGAILTALYEGSTETSFHKALLKKRRGKAHPLAADFRKDGDGRLALLKLVAVLAHVRLDELVQRDAQRRMRRFALLAATVSIATISAAALIFAVLQARTAARAERDRNAEAVEFQLGMRPKLQAAGQLDVLADLNKGVARLFAGRDPATLSIKEQVDRTVLLQGSTDDDLTRGNFAAARKAATEASIITRALMKAHPGEGDVIYADAQSEYWLGECDWLAGALAAARGHFELYAERARQLRAIDPHNFKWLIEQPYARSNLAMLALLGSADTSHARPLFESAQSDLVALAKQQPDDADLSFEVADGEAWLASTASVGRDYAAAFAHRTTQMKMLDALTRRFPLNVRYRDARIGALIGFARLAAARGDFADAQRQFDAAHDLAILRQASEPHNGTLKQDARSIEIFKVRTWLAAPPKLRPAPTAMAKVLGGCDAEWRKADNRELATFCSIESARVKLLLGDRDGARREIAAAEHSADSRNVLSRRWNLDLNSEIQAVQARLQAPPASPPRVRPR